jgi:hypothetical protein
LSRWRHSRLYINGLDRTNKVAVYHRCDPPSSHLSRSKKTLLQMKMTTQNERSVVEFESHKGHPICGEFSGAGLPSSEIFAFHNPSVSRSPLREPGRQAGRSAGSWGCRAGWDWRARATTRPRGNRAPRMYPKAFCTRREAAQAGQSRRPRPFSLGRWTRRMKPRRKSWRSNNSISAKRIEIGCWCDGTVTCDL